MAVIAFSSISFNETVDVNGGRPSADIGAGGSGCGPAIGIALGSIGLGIAGAAAYDHARGVVKGATGFDAIAAGERAGEALVGRGSRPSWQDTRKNHCETE